MGKSLVDENKSYKKMSLKEVFLRFKPFYKDYIFYFFLSIVGMLLASGGTAASAYIIEPILNKIFIDKDKALLYYLPFLIVGIYFLKNLGAYMQVYYISFIGIDTLKRLRLGVLSNILSLDMKFFHRFKTGELISRCMNDIAALQNIVATIIPEIIREVITSIGLIGVVIYQSPVLAFFALIILPCTLYPLSRFAKRLKTLGRNSQETNSKLSALLSEQFTNIELIKANNSASFEEKRFDKLNSNLCDINLKCTRINALASPMMEGIGSLGIAIVVIIGGKEVIDGALSVGGFFSFLTALFMSYTPIKRLSSLYSRLQEALAASERTFYLMDLRPALNGGKVPLADISRLDFDNVYLDYYGKPALKGVSFSLAKNSSLALVGKSGSGKSSVINLLMHFYEKKSGKILINSKPLEDFCLHDLRSQIAIVTQNIYLFNASVEENIAYANKLDHEKVIRACKDANAYEFIEEMGGLKAQIKENGKNLSGGQKQRIAIARALYKDPKLLIFDEATSALDNESEALITKSLEVLKKDRMIIIIAHRLSSIKNVDNIAVLDFGKVVAFGKEETLLKESEIYRKLKSPGPKAG